MLLLLLLDAVDAVDMVVEMMAMVLLAVNAHAMSLMVGNADANIVDDDDVGTYIFFSYSITIQNNTNIAPKSCNINVECLPRNEFNIMKMYRFDYDTS